MGHIESVTQGQEDFEPEGVEQISWYFVEDTFLYIFMSMN